LAPPSRCAISHLTGQGSWC